MNEKNINLTAAEISSLWTAYMSDSMAKQMLRFMLKDLEDPDIKPIVQYAYDTSSRHLEQLLSIFKKENFATPTGFTEEDVNMNAPWLFTDIFCLSYVNHLAKVGMITYGASVSMCARKDIQDYFIEGLTESANLYKRSNELALAKGINARHPYIETPNEVDYVDNKNYMSGLNPFNEKRPLNAVEISHLYNNIATNSIGVKLCLAFAQTSPLKEVQEFMLRAKEISKKHIKLFVEALLKEEVNAPQIPDVAVSDSTTQTFSDKLIMFHMSVISSAGIGNYATAAAASQRSDLMLNYERLSKEVMRLAKSGADIMITNNWLEQPPGIKDREKLAKNKEKNK